MRTSVDVHNVLSEKNIPYEIIPISCSISSAGRMAEVLNLSPFEVVKSILFMTDGEPILAILSSEKKISYKKLKKATLISNLRLATLQELIDITGYMPGATPPVAHKVSIRTVIDDDLKTQNVIYTSAGELNAVLKMKVFDLKKITCAKVYDLTKD
ncbi:YbaK/EbsC family protein [Candidatus Oleimmundimicrobium sp.]|uniref:aminoacyl-tRNA deacylase n=1 Tax=Candidatus Oleimmundimicrobium sp. TaxID=3060597 RepID=UPI0027279CE7|nr:YbaK/EbsC family protein [Candidatus Oleimmundimicrobium sp.]MDO8886243.1 YbaK/EbsC family protein [Candidatus Oleimmundimicrobium sp.]